ncbi:MAG: hypothetical protein U5N86_11660 [Planctomycetota bacterium]|nr:hypothetical protein [Planctomycetota bacterium]
MPRAKTSDRRTIITVALRLALFFAIAFAAFSLAFHNSPKTHAENARGAQISIPNSRFKCSTDETGLTTAERWLFLERVPGCALLRPPAGDGVLISSSSNTARADLLSTSRKMPPFKNVEVELEYETVLGSPVLFICLRPNLNRFDVDLEFLERAKVGRTVTDKVRLHTGEFEGDYGISVSITGIGVARLKSIRAWYAGDYKRPDNPVFVLNLLSDHPPEDGKLPWKNIHKLRSVFGFPSIEHAHFEQLTEEILKESDPSLVVLSPSSSKIDKPNRKKVEAALKIVDESGLPIVGICLGHQWFARYRGSRVTRGKEWGIHTMKMLARDPVFDGLPRLPFFYVSQSHNFMVDKPPSDAVLLASSKAIECQMFRYRRPFTYTTQFHFERDWEDSAPGGCVMWKNILRNYGLIE